MKNLCTIADYNFRNRVWALNQSLLNKSDNYVLYVLALDQEALECFQKDSWKNSNIKAVFIDDLIKKDAHLSTSSNNNPSPEAVRVAQGNLEKAQRMQFIWSLSPYFTWFCLDQYEIEDILYIDADIYFFGNWEEIYNHTSEISVGIVEHRCPYSAANGKYNVGIVYFKNDINGYKCLTWWKDCLLFTDHEFYKTHGMCGDQKYLELFEKLFNNVVVMDKFIGHLAPWNYNTHKYSGDKIIWNNTEQDLMYCHFSNFKPNYDNNSYIPAQRHGISTISHPFVKKIYDEYFSCLREVNA
jgi:hypothetical protein